MKKLAIGLMMTSVLSACSLVPEFHLPQTEMPQQWRGEEATLPAAAERDDTWWTRFHSEELDTLIPAALEHNNDMRASLATVLSDEDYSVRTVESAEEALAIVTAEAGLAPTDDPYKARFLPHELRINDDWVLQD